MKETIKLTEKELKQIIKESVEETLNTLDEGIDFDEETMEVSFNPHHEENVDTSIDNNPTMDDTILNGIPVWSIFKRKYGNRKDGNPLIYALKGENGWHFKSEYDRKMISKQFSAIADKFAKEYKIGVTIVVPSGSFLNEYIADVIASKSSDAYILNDVIRKLTVEEVDKIVLDKSSYFRQVYEGEFKEAYRRLCGYFDLMDKERGGMFTRHLIYDSEMRDVLTDTLTLSKDRFAEDSKVINGRDILIIYDTVSRGQTIQNACKILTDAYAPNSITVLTLLSRLY